MRIAYLDCISGISGDMALAALVDAGADRSYIVTELSKLALQPYTLSWKTVNKNGISSLKADVTLDPEHPPRHHRHYSEIIKIIRDAELPERASARSLAVFEKIAIAEAKIHGVPLDRVHFHEVGAVDSIVDTVGVALALESLNAELIVCSSVPLGYGTVRCAHGAYPIPAPATLEMMKGLPIRSLSIAKELTTPTGAGIVSGLASRFSEALPAMNVDSVGYGAGTLDLREQPNVLRVVVGEWQEEASRDHHGHSTSHS